MATTPTTDANTLNEPLGIMLRIFSGIAFTVMVVCIKYLSAAIPLGQIVFFRSIFAMIPLIGFLLWSQEFPGGLYTQRPFAHIFRCVTGSLAMFTSFAAIRYLPIAEATMLSYLSPIFMIILAAVFLGEAVLARRWIGVGLGLLGVLAMTGPALNFDGSNQQIIGIGLGLITAVLTAIALIQVRHMSRLGEGAGAIAFYFVLVAALGGLVSLPLGWVMPNTDQFAFLIGAGISGGFAHIFMTISFRHAEASTLAPFEYLTVLWATLAGVVLFSDIPGLGFMIAVALILAGVIIARPKR